MANSARIDDLKKKFDENPRRYFAPLANEYRKSGDPDQAIAICREFLPQQPGHMSGHIVYGQALFDAQQLDEAKAVFDTALTLDPENLIALRYLGDIARGMGDPPTARLWYQRVLDADPRNAEISALLTELADAPGPPPAAATPVEAPVDEAPATGPTGTVVMESFSLEGLTGSAPPETEPAPAPEPVSDSAPPAPPPAGTVPEPTAGAGSVSSTESTPEPSADATAESGAGPAADLELDEELFEAGAGGVTGQGPTAESGEEEPPEAPAPPADELLDLDELNLETDSPVMPGTNAPRPSLDTVGFDIERAGDGLLMPAFDMERESEPEPSPEELELEPEPVAEAEAEVEPVAEVVTDFYSMDDLELPPPEAAGSTPPPASDPFATETMADLYRSQGHLENALRVYRQLLAQRPGDAGLQATISQLEAAVRMTPPSGQAVPDLDTSDFSFESDAGATPAAGTASMAGDLERDTDAAEAAATGDTPAAELEGLTPYGVDAPPRAPSGPSIREFLLALGSYVLGGGSGAANGEAESPEGQLETSAVDAGEPPAGDDTPESMAGIDAAEPAVPEAAASPESAAAPEPDPVAAAEPEPELEPEPVETIETMAWAGVESLETTADLDSTDESTADSDAGDLPADAEWGTTPAEPTPAAAMEAHEPPSAGEAGGGARSPTNSRPVDRSTRCSGRRRLRRKIRRRRRRLPARSARRRPRRRRSRCRGRRRAGPRKNCRWTACFASSAAASSRLSSRGSRSTSSSRIPRRPWDPRSPRRRPRVSRRRPRTMTSSSSTPGSTD